MIFCAIWLKDRWNTLPSIYHIYFWILPILLDVFLYATKIILMHNWCCLKCDQTRKNSVIIIQFCLIDYAISIRNLMYSKQCIACIATVHPITSFEKTTHTRHIIFTRHVFIRVLKLLTISFSYYHKWHVWLSSPSH